MYLYFVYFLVTRNAKKKEANSKEKDPLYSPQETNSEDESHASQSTSDEEEEEEEEEEAEKDSNASSVLSNPEDPGKRLVAKLNQFLRTYTTTIYGKSLRLGCW